MTDYRYLTFSVTDGIGHLALNRPEKKNAINDQLCLEIEDVFRNLPGDLNVILLTGNGPEFCSGLDLSEHTAREPFEVVDPSKWLNTHACGTGYSAISATPACRWSLRCTVPLLVVAWNWRPAPMFAFPTTPPSTACPKAAMAFLSVAEPQSR